MLCYRDRTYCGSKVHKPDCDNQFVPDENYRRWSKELHMKNGPVAYADFCGDPKEEP